MKSLIKICYSAFFFLSLVSCSSLQLRYNTLNTAAQYDALYSRQPKSVLAITEAGDTVQVSIKDITRKYSYGEYFKWQFNWNNQWYPYSTFPYYFYRNNYSWYRPYLGYSPSWWRHNWSNTPPIYYSVPSIPRVKGRRGSNNIRRNEINANPIRGNKPPQSRSNGRRSWSREVVPSQPTRPRISTPSQPRQIRRGSQQLSLIHI